MKCLLLCISIICLAFPNIVPIHSGGTDGAGGHYDHSTGEYHYHHGHPAHQHPNGECPYDVQEEYDCGREDCNMVGPHGHINKPKTTTTTTSRTQKQENDSVSKDASDNNNDSWSWIFELCIIILPIIVIVNFDKIKNFFRKR